jgi:hypothetical protein
MIISNREILVYEVKSKISRLPSAKSLKQRIKKVQQQISQ